MKGLALITGIIVISLLMVNVDATMTTYYVREDFDDLTGWYIPPNANFTVENGELVFGMPKSQGVWNKIYKNITVGERTPPHIEIKANMRGKLLEEPPLSTSTFYYVNDIVITLKAKSYSLWIKYETTIYDNLDATTVNNCCSTITIGGENNTVTSYTIFYRTNQPHEKEHSSSIDIQMTRKTPLSWDVEIYRYNGYNFTNSDTTDARPKITTMLRLNDIESINITIRNRESGTPIEAPFHSDMIYIVSEDEINETENGVEQTMIYLIPITVFGGGISTAITGNPKYKYLILISFALFGIFAIIYAQYFLSAIALISTGAYGYIIKKGGGFFE